MQTYTANRERLLAQNIEAISDDDRFVPGEPFQYQGGSVTSLLPDCESQIETIYQLAAEMETIMPKIEALGGFVRPSPMPTLEIFMNFAKEKCSSSL